MTCARCKKRIQGAYITALGQTWHPEHFVCTTCKKPFAGSRFYERDGKPYCKDDYQQRFSPRCAGCEQPITGRYTTALGKTWHPEHFVCTTCKKPFAGSRFYERDGKPYCEHDYHEGFSPRCAICNTAMRGTYLTNAWGDSFCPAHDGQLPKCYSCSRLVSKSLTGGGQRYADGRVMCNHCRRTAIDHHHTSLSVLAEVRRTLARIGLDLGQHNIPLRLVDQTELNQLSTKSYSQQPSGMARTQLRTRNGQVVKRQVTEILVLHGLPREHTAAIIAHELGHAWLFLNAYPKLPPMVEEGICEYSAYLWLKQQGTAEAAYRLKLLQNNKDPIYGAGFQAAYRAARGRSLAQLLAYVRQHRRFPR